ncbi:MAG TPA: 5'-nucleotidase C-terminal domain-containing protein [Cerasibacillus sp.]|uniref:5'-nucleotidase C-terminal domain-containing protein n=1 Tax=Cerasibacillus sp. TaxID=2498711 RepID=UPI002F42E770
MRKNKIYQASLNLLLSILLIVSFMPLHALAEEAGANEFDLTVMHMNDTHAHVEALPKMLTAIKQVRAEKENTVLLHAGDVFSGTLYFNEFSGQADLALMNLMGFDAMVYGNHEFDRGSSEGGHKSLAEFVAGANFPLLGTNLDFSSDPYMVSLVENPGKFVENPEGGKTYHSIVKEIDGEKIGILGLTTEDTPAISSAVQVQFLNYIAEAKEAVKQFEEVGINKIIAVTHLGYDSNPAVGNDLVLAEQVEGIDIIVGGHSHTKLTEPTVIEGKEPTVIVQAGQYAENLGKLDVTFDENGVITEHSGVLIATEDKADDPEAAEALKEFSDDIEQLKNKPSGAEAKKDLPNPRQEKSGDDSVRANETELGNLVTDAMLAKAKEKFPKTVIALQNGGGIRAPINKGPITTGEIISVLPFGNDPVVVTLTGAELKEILEHSVRLAPGENGGFLHVSGMRYKYDSAQEAGSRVLVMEVKEGDTYVPIEENKEYMITTNQFTAMGGDGYNTFAKAYAEGRVTNIGEIDWEQLKDYMVNEEYLDGQVDPVREGRIIDIARDEIVWGQVAPIEISPEATEVEAGTMIGLTTATKDATIYYTMNGSDPSETNGYLYDGQIEIDRDVTIKAIALKHGYLPSDVAEFTFTIKQDSKEPTDPNDDNNKDDGNKDKGKGSDKGNDHDDQKDGGNGTNNKNDNTNDPKPSTNDTNKTNDGTGGNKLPNTATQMYNFMLYGAILLIIGASIVIYRKFKTN